MVDKGIFSQIGNEPINIFLVEPYRLLLNFFPILGSKEIHNYRRMSPHNIYSLFQRHLTLEFLFFSNFFNFEKTRFSHSKAWREPLLMTLLTSRSKHSNIFSICIIY